MQSRRRHNQRGFTLVELTVVLVLAAVIVASLYQLFYTGRRSHEVNKNLIDMQQNARVAIESLTEDFRHVSYGKDPTQPSIRYAGPDSIVFVADLMTEVPGAEVIAYYLDPEGDEDTPNPDDTILMKTVADSGGALILQTPQSYGIAQGGLSLRYFNGGGQELPNPVPQPELIGEMTVEVVTTEAESWKQAAYAEMSLSSTVYPRNLPLSPARSRPSTPACGEPTYPNCASARLTWETPTTNTDGTDLPLSDISHFNFYFGTDPDDMGLSARLARMINEWTVGNLGCDTYYIGVSCVSRSGVESYLCTRQISVAGNKVPKPPAALLAADSSGVLLNWSAVTQYTDDTSITVPVEYLVHRSLSPGFVPDDDTEVGTVQGSTRYHDSVPADCATYYYLVTARVCCNEGDPSPEGSIDRPSAPQCPSSLAGIAGNPPDHISVSWSHPTLREDLTTLPIDEISATWVYYDTLPGATLQKAVVSGTGTSVTLTGLTGCKTYYIHARTVDSCGHPSAASCLGNEIAVALASPCDEAPPSAPVTTYATGLDERIDIEWPANTADCDLYGYQIYYGGASGVYTGTEALEGPSPITVGSPQVNHGGLCAYSLTGLSGCQTVYVAIKALDNCEPPNESPYSPEASGMTTCVPCNISSSCPHWVATPASANRDLRLEVYTASAGDETLARLLPTYSGTARVLEVLYGRPLVSIWKHDGSAGEDGAVGPQGSAATLDLDDVTVPAWTTQEDGQPLAVLFDGDVRDVDFDLKFKNPSGGFCTATDVNRGASIFDDFDDGNITGWSVRSGTWSSNNGELYQSSTLSNRLLIGSDVLGDITYEGKVCVTSGTTAYFVFRYTDDNNFYLAGIRTDTDQVRLARVRSGSFTQTGSYTATIDRNNWYGMKVVVSSKRVRVFLDCVEVIDAEDTLMNATGKIGFRTSSTAARWDDIRCQSAAVLP